MSVVAKGGSNGGDFPDPPTGLVAALCIDVIDLGEQKSMYKNERTGADKMQHKIKIVWQTHTENEDGEPCVRTDGKPFRLSKYYTLSLNEKANLRKDLDSWRGKPFTDEELAEGFDVEDLLGVACKLSLASKPRAQGGTYVGVDAVLRPSKRDPQITRHPDFVREKDVPGGQDVRSPKEGSKPPQQQQQQKQTFEEEEDDLPF